MCNIKFIYLVIFCDPWAFLLGRVALQYPKITTQVKIQELQCAVQPQSAHNENPTVQHTYKEHNNSIKWVLFKHDFKHQLLFVCGRPLSIIVLFCRPTVPPNLFFSISFFSDGCQESFHRSAMPPCKCGTFLSDVQVATYWNKIIMCIFIGFGDAFREELQHFLMDWIITSWPFCSNEKQWNFQMCPEWFLKERKKQIKQYLTSAKSPIFMQLTITWQKSIFSICCPNYYPLTCSWLIRSSREGELKSIPPSLIKNNLPVLFT